MAGYSGASQTQQNPELNEFIRSMNTGGSGVISKSSPSLPSKPAPSKPATIPDDDGMTEALGHRRLRSIDGPEPTLSHVSDEFETDPNSVGIQGSGIRSAR